jgi:hypothetical protein
MTDKPKKLSDTARALLTAAAMRNDHLVPFPKLPVAAARQVVRSLLNAGFAEEVRAPINDPGYAWRTAGDDGALALRVTASGLDQIAAREAATAVATRPIEADQLGALGGAQAPKAAGTSIGRTTHLDSLHRAAQALLDAWDGTTGIASAPARPTHIWPTGRFADWSVPSGACGTAAGREADASSQPSVAGRSARTCVTWPGSDFSSNLSATCWATSSATRTRWSAILPGTGAASRSRPRSWRARSTSLRSSA